MYFLIFTGKRIDIGGYELQRSYYPLDNIQYSPCSLVSVWRNTALGTVFPRTLPRANIGNTSSRGKHCQYSSNCPVLVCNFNCFYTSASMLVHLLVWVCPDGYDTQRIGCFLGEKQMHDNYDQDGQTRYLTESLQMKACNVLASSDLRISVLHKAGRTWVRLSRGILVLKLLS